MAQSWFQHHLVSWTRKTRGSASGIDDAPLTDATNFPQSIYGDLQIQSGDRLVRVRGVEVTVSARFFTQQSGIVANDQITYGGRTYTVLLVIPQYRSNNAVDHYECILNYET